jgi:hypothetical protein
VTPCGIDDAAEPQPRLEPTTVQLASLVSVAQPHRQLLERAACLRVIVAEVEEMSGRLAAAGDRARLASLRHLARHYQAELAQVERELGAAGPAPLAPLRAAARG